MKEIKPIQYQKSQSRNFNYREVYELYHIHGLSLQEIISKTGYSRSSIFRILHNFATTNPIVTAQMKKKGKGVTPRQTVQHRRHPLLRAGAERRHIRPTQRPSRPCPVAPHPEGCTGQINREQGAPRHRGQMT